jgi:hypothetical protein
MHIKKMSPRKKISLKGGNATKSSIDKYNEEEEFRAKGKR